MDRLYWCTPPFPQRSCKLCMGPGANLDQMRRSTHNLGACSYCYYKSNSSRPKWGQRSPLSDTHCSRTVLLSRSLSPQWWEVQQQTLQQSSSSLFNGFLESSSWADCIRCSASLLRAPTSVVSTRRRLRFFGGQCWLDNSLQNSSMWTNFALLRCFCIKASPTHIMSRKPNPEVGLAARQENCRPHLAPPEVNSAACALT